MMEVVQICKLKVERMLNLQYSLPVVKDRTGADKHRESIQAACLGDRGEGGIEMDFRGN